MDAEIRPLTPSSTGGTNTPTHSISKTDYITCDGAVPWPGETFIIRDRISGLVITLKDGNLRLEATPSKVGGCYWTCIEKNGWLGFRNSVSGTYMGIGAKELIVANASHHKRYEYICARRHPDGGYLLLMGYGEKLLNLAIRESGTMLVLGESGEQTKWEFEKV